MELKGSRLLLSLDGSGQATMRRWRVMRAHRFRFPGSETAETWPIINARRTGQTGSVHHRSNAYFSSRALRDTDLGLRVGKERGVRVFVCVWTMWNPGKCDASFFVETFFLTVSVFGFSSPATKPATIARHCCRYTSCVYSAGTPIPHAWVDTSQEVSSTWRLHIRDPGA